MFLTNPRLGLARRETTTLTHAKGLNVRCISGLLWITVEGDPIDYWLEPGESLAIARPGKVIIGAERASEIELRRAPRITPRKTLDARLQLA